MQNMKITATCQGADYNLKDTFCTIKNTSSKQPITASKSTKLLFDKNITLARKIASPSINERVPDERPATPKSSVKCTAITSPFIAPPVPAAPKKSQKKAINNSQSHNHRHHRKNAKKRGATNDNSLCSSLVKKSKLNSSSSTFNNYNKNINHISNHNNNNNIKNDSNKSSGTGSVKINYGSFNNIHDRLRELYFELLAEDDSDVNKLNLRNTSFLLEKLILRDKLNTLILNLYPGNKGYSIAFKNQSNDTNETSTTSINHGLTKTQSGAGTTSIQIYGDINNENMLESKMWPYEEEELLEYINNEELPLIIIDLLEKKCSYLFYSGCIIAEIRDYRQLFPICNCDTYHVLLRPTNQTLLADVNQILSDGEWNNDDKLSLESQLVLATSEPLCLDPNPKIGAMSIKKQYHRQLLNTVRIRRQAKKYSQLAINRKRKTDQFTKQISLHLTEFMTRYRSKPHLMQLHKTGVISFTVPKKPQYCRPIGPPNLDFPSTLTLTPTMDIDVKQFGHAFDRQKESKDCIPLLLEEYILETDRYDGRVYHIKLSIFHRPSNLEYLGELYVDHNYKAGEKNGAACQFILGNQAHAHRYIQQFSDIFTEEGRKPVRITHIVPGKPVQVTCTPGMREQSTEKKPEEETDTDNPPRSPQSQTPSGSQSQAASSSQTATVTQPTQATTLPPPQHLPPTSSPSPVQQTQNQRLKTINSINSNTSVSNNNNNNQIVITGPSIMQPHLFNHPTSTVATTATSVTITISTATTTTFTSTTPNTTTSAKVSAVPTVSISSPIMNSVKCDSTHTINNINITKPLSVCNNGSLVLVQQTGDSGPNSGTINCNQTNTNNNNTILVATTSSSLIQSNQIQSTPRINITNVIPTQNQFQSAIITQQPVMSTIATTSNATSPITTTTIPSTNPEINALVTSLMNSETQFNQQRKQQQQLQQQQLQTSTSTTTSPTIQIKSNQPSNNTNNAAIISLLNSAPAAMTNSHAKHIVDQENYIKNNSANRISVRKIVPISNRLINHHQQPIISVRSTNPVVNNHSTNATTQLVSTIQLQQPQTQKLTANGSDTQKQYVRVTTMTALESQLQSPLSIFTNASTNMQSFGTHHNSHINNSNNNNKLIIQNRTTPTNNIRSIVSPANSGGSNSGNETNTVTTDQSVNASLLNSNLNVASDTNSYTILAGSSSSSSPSPADNNNLTNSNTHIKQSTLINTNSSNTNSSALIERLTSNFSSNNNSNNNSNSSNSSSANCLSVNNTCINSNNSNNNNINLQQQLTTSTIASIQNSPINSNTSTSSGPPPGTVFTTLSPKLIQQMQSISPQPSPSPQLMQQQPQTQQQQQPTTTLNLANLTSVPGLQNVQVQIPGLDQPISLSLSSGNSTHGNNLLVSGGVLAQFVSNVKVPNQLRISTAANNSTIGGANQPIQFVRTATQPIQRNISLVAQTIPSTSIVTATNSGALNAKQFTVIGSLSGRGSQMKLATPIAVSVAASSSTISSKPSMITTQKLQNKIQKQVQLKQCLKQQSTITSDTLNNIGLSLITTTTTNATGNTADLQNKRRKGSTADATK